MLSTRAITELTERNNRLEAARRKEKVQGQITEEKAIGYGTALVTSTLAGYVDGRFDLKDGEDGNGVTLFGIPVMPVAAGVLAAGGLMAGGKVGSALGYAGLGVACGWSYGRAQAAGEKASS